MKICITGGAGFIGSHLTDLYVSAGHEVVIIDNFSTGKKENLNPAARLYETDITGDAIPGIFEKEKFDIVSHHAAQMNVRVSVDSPQFDASVNILGSLNVFEACRNTAVKKIIFASSGGTVYGDQDILPATEESFAVPCSPYGIGKLCVEKYLYYYKETYGIDYAALRYGNVFGPRQNPHGEAGVVAIFFTKFLDGQQPVINGDGAITRDYIYIDDVGSANMLALEDKVTGIFNVTTGIETDVNGIFDKIKQLTGSPLERFHGPAKAGEQRRSVCSFDKFKSRHGWQPEVNFDEGIRKTLEYYLDIRK